MDTMEHVYRGQNIKITFCIMTFVNLHDNLTQA